MSTTALLRGIDYEGDSREIWQDSIDSATALGRTMIQGEYAWLSFEVWAGDDGEWQQV